MERMKPRETRWGKGACVLLGLCVFAFLLLFFFSVHPLMMHDGDDWGYSSYTRSALPVWGGWNPTRVLPELLSPLFAYAAAYLVLPLIPELSWAMAAVYALFFSLAITAYVMLFVRFVRRRFELAHGVCAALGLLFFLSHFLIFRSQTSGNVHMFYCWNVNTYFFYLLPDLMGASLVLYWGADAERSFAIDAKRPVASGWMLVLLYLTVFSNLFASYIAAVYAGLTLVGRALCALREKRRAASVTRDGAWLIVVLALWLVSAVFELSGARADALATDLSFIERLRAVYGGLLEVIGRLNPLFTAVCLFALAAGCAALFFPHRAKAGDGAMCGSLWLLLPAFLLSGCYLVLLAAKASPSYIVRPDVIFGAVFFMLLLVMCAMAYLMRRRPALAMLVPVLCFVFFFEIDTRWGTFKEPNVDNLPARECAAINQALIDQIMDAAARGETAPEIEVPDGPYWYIADSMAVTLYKCGLIDREMYATNAVIDDFYEKYGIR